jgi:hypothetical protein
MKIKKTNKIHSAVYVDPENFIYFHKFLNSYFKLIKYEVRCNDHSIIIFKSVEELLDYENPDFKRIVRIDIACSNEEDSNFIRIFPEFSFSLGSTLTPIEYSINFTDYHNAISFEKELENRIKEFKPWYSRISTANISSIIMLILLFVFLLIIFFGAYLDITGQFQNTSDTQKSSPYLFLTILISGALIVWLFTFILERVQKFLFPKIVVNLGKQKRDYAKKSNLIYFIIVIILLTIILNIVANYLSSLLFG